MAALPGIGASMRTPEAASLSAISSAKFTTELTLTPGAGSSSNLVTEGPRVTATTLARTRKSSSVCSKIAHCSLISSSVCLSLETYGGLSNSKGGNKYVLASAAGRVSVFTFSLTAFLGAGLAAEIFLSAVSMIFISPGF